MLRRTEPRQLPRRSAKILTPASVRWAIRHRAYTPWYLVRYLRYARMRLANRGAVVTGGMVFLDRGAQIYARPGLGRVVVGKWVHLGANTKLRCHEGTLTIGDRCSLARDITVNCYLDIEIGACTLIADSVYISDFDHRFDDTQLPIKDQGILKSRVRIGPDVWLGTKATVTRGVTVGAGCVVGANAVVTRDLPAAAVAVGAPARVIKSRAGTTRRA